MNILEIIGIGKEVGKVLNKVLDQIPDSDQRTMNEFFKFENRYNEEIAREDADHDDLILWRERRKVLLDTILREINKG